MAQITGRTVYILGAGASFHTGAPLLRDFLVKARLLLEGKQKPVSEKSFKEVFQWIDSLRASSYYVDFDLDNLEHLFSLADMGKQLNFPKEIEIFDALLDVIAETLDQCELNIDKRSGEYAADQTYTDFAVNLRTNNENRAKLLGKNCQSLESDVIITFNYDVMLDHAMRQTSQRPHYCLRSEPKGGEFALLKLHGSVNWGRCPNDACQDVLTEITPAFSAFSARLLTPSEEPDFTTPGPLKVPFSLVEAVLKKSVCGNCRTPDQLKPFLIPPTWSKAVGKTPIVQVWKSAVKAIEEASQLVVIGYSLPPTDTFFQYLLTLGLKKNSALNRVVVVNPDPHESFQPRYKQVFSRSLAERGRLKFIPLTFQEFIAKNSGDPDSMRVIGTQI